VNASKKQDASGKDWREDRKKHRKEREGKERKGLMEIRKFSHCCCTR